MANATSTQLQELYVAYFGRAADPTGLDYWTEKGITTSKFAADMYAQAEFKDAYGSLSTESQVNQIYQNLFDRDADAAGLLYWTKQIDLGNLQLAEIANDLIWAAQNNSGSEDDKTALTNKTNAAVAYTAKVKETTSAILAYQAESTSPWTSGVNIAEAVSYMAGIDKDTESTTAGIAASVTTITNNGVPSLAKNYSLTSGVDELSGTAGTNKFQAGLTTSGGNTINSLDTIDGGAGTDTLNATIATSVTPGSIKNIENLNLTFDAASKTFNASNVTGVTTLTDIGSTALGTTSNIGSTTTDLVVSDNSVGATFTYKASSVTGTADAIDLTFANATGNAITTITGAVETLNVKSSTSANAVRLNSGATTLNITGDADLSLLAASSILDDTTTIDASGASGAITLAHDHGTASTSVTITGGSGNDSLTLTGTNTATDTISGGAGNDTLTFGGDLADADVINGGAGTDTLVGDDGELVALTTANNVSNIEVLEASTVLASGTLTTANVDSTISSVKLAAGANAGTVVFGAGSNTLTMGTASAGALVVTDTGLATNDTLTINASTVDSFNNNSVAINGFETVNFSTGTGSTTDEQDVSTFNITGDPDAAGTRTVATLNISGKGNFHASGIITVGTDNSGTGTIDASALTGNFVMGGIGAGVSTITGGSGSDTILGDAVASTLTGGAGNDAITGNTKSDTISGGAGNDTLTLTAGGSGVNDTITGGAGNDIFFGTDANLVAGHVLSGGEGTDTLKIDDFAAVTDAQFENNTSIEVLTSDATGLSATLDVYAQAMGITTVTFAGTGTAGVGDTVTIQDDFTNAVTVNLDELDDGGSTDDSVTVDATTYTGALTIKTAIATAITGDEGNAATAEVSLTGGTGTSDTLSFHGGTYSNTHLTGVTAIENFVQQDDVTSSITIDELNIADGKTLTIDVRSIINSGNSSTVVLSDDSNGISTVHGGTGVDTITGSSSDLGDTLYGYAGSDIIKFIAAQLTTLDTVDGGAGTDTINIITTAATLADADFTNISNVEALTFTVASSDTDLGAEYTASGSTTITTGNNTLTNDLNLDSVTTAQTLNLGADADTIDASSMTAGLTVVYAESEDMTSADTITAGTSTSDVLTITFDITAPDLTNVSGFETIKSGANTASFALTTFDANTAATKSLDIDMSAQTSAAYTVNVSAETNAAVTITGGEAASTITLTSSSLGDTFTGGAGIDALTVIGAQLTSADTLNGAGGTDTLTIGTVGTLSDADFTNISNFETLIGGDGAITMVLGAEYAAAGFVTHTEHDNGNTDAVNITYGSGVTTDQTYNMKTSSTTITATGMTGDLTVAAIEGDILTADTLTGGSGSDTLNVTFSGTAATSGDTDGITSFENFKSATDHNGGFTFLDANFVSNNFTVNAESVTTATNTFTVDASAEDDSTMTYTGSAGIDTVTGTDTTASGDTISTGAAADVITGGRGPDTITGGAGADVFTYTAVNQSTGSERDSILDFTSGTDKIAVTIDQSSSNSGVTIDATVQTARAGTSLIQENMSGSIGQTFYDTTNSRVIVNNNADALVTTLDYQIGVNAAATATSTIAAVDMQYTVTGGAGADTIVVDGGADVVVGGAGVDKITITDTTAAADKVTITVGASSIDYITGFSAGGGATNDNLLAPDATHAWLAVDTTNVDGVVGLGTGASLKAAEASNTDATVVTVSANVTANTFDGLEAGTTSEGTMESAVITAVGKTGGLATGDIILMFVDDNEHTGVFKVTSGDQTTDDALAAAEFEIMAVLKGVADATSIAAADILFA